MATASRGNSGRRTTNGKTSGKSSSGRSSSNQKRTSNNSGKRYNSSSKKTTNKKKTSKKQEVSVEIKHEAILIILCMAVIFLFLCMINVIGGSVGPGIKHLILGLFGILGYLAPVVIAVGIIFKMMNKYDTLATIKLVSGIVGFIMLGVLMSHFTGTPVKEIGKYENIFKELYELQNGGGVFFGLIAIGLFKIMGNGGSIFFAIAIILVAVIIITEKSLLNFLRTRRDNWDEDEDEPEDEEEYYQQTIADTKVNNKNRKKKGIGDYLNNEDDRNNKSSENVKSNPENSDNSNVVISDNNLSDNNSDKINAPLSVNNEFHKPVKKDEIHEITIKNIDKSTASMSSSGHFDNKTISKIGMASDNEILNANPITNKADNSMDDDDFIKPIDSSTNESHDVIATVSSQIISPIISPIEEVTVAHAEHIALPKEVVIGVGASGSSKSLVSGDTDRLNNMVTPTTERTHEANDKALGEIKVPVKPKRTAYKKPPIDLLKKNENKSKGDSDIELKKTAVELEKTLEVFGVNASVSDICQGPSVTRFEITLAEGVKVNKIVSLADDLKLRLAAQDIRMEAPIPGKSAVGIEIPNKVASGVGFRDLIENRKYKEAESNLTFAVGKDISGDTIIADIAKMPHMLIAGATGSGKSVCINTLIMSILYKANPDDVKLIMIDPKVVELSVYNGIPHLLLPVVTDPRKASAALYWAVNEMTKRYNDFAEFGVRDLKGFNEKAASLNDPIFPKKPQIVVIVDELADLMMVASKEVEESICRLAQLARAAGIHLIIATQRPSVDVITGLIKANMPSRVAFKVSSGVDSRTILDSVGAEKLLGKGDMLFYPQGQSKPTRVQGAFISDDEVGKVVEFLKNNSSDDVYDEAIVKEINNISNGGSKETSNSAGNSSQEEDGFDEYFEKACYLVLDKQKASSGMLQRVYKIGFNRAARIIDQMESVGIVGPEEGTKPRRVLVNEMELSEILKQIN